MRGNKIHQAIVQYPHVADICDIRSLGPYKLWKARIRYIYYVISFYASDATFEIEGEISIAIEDTKRTDLNLFVRTGRITFVPPSFFL